MSKSIAVYSSSDFWYLKGSQKENLRNICAFPVRVNVAIFPYSSHMLIR